MRVAVSGAHRTGKTTLIEELGRVLPAYEAVDEPYCLLAEEGHECAEMPSLDDFELQLERSIQCVTASHENQLFGRCPADILAYLTEHHDSEGFDLDQWLPRVRTAMQRLDLVVFVPIETPDRVVVGVDDERELRWRVDDALRDILLDDRWDFGVEAVEVSGGVRDRARQVLALLHGHDA